MISSYPYRCSTDFGPSDPALQSTTASLASASAFQVSPPGADPYNQLTARERQVLQLIAEGKTNRECAKILKLSVKTVDTHRAHLMRKLDIHDQTSLVKYAIRRGIVQVH